MIDGMVRNRQKDLRWVLRWVLFRVDKTGIILLIGIDVAPKKLLLGWNLAVTDKLEWNVDGGGRTDGDIVLVKALEGGFFLADLRVVGGRDHSADLGCDKRIWGRS